MSELNLMTRDELYQEVLRLRSCMTGEHGLADKVPTEIWLAYERRATDAAAMHGNGSAALKAGILRLTLDAWLSGHMVPGAPSAWVVVYADGSRGLAFTADEADEAIAEAHAGAFREPLFALSPPPSSKLGCATQKTGQSAENAEGAGSSPAGVDALTVELAEALALVASGQGWLYARDLDYFALADEAIVGVLRHYSPGVQAAGVSDGNLITELVGALKLLLAARKDHELMSAAIVAEAAIANAEGRS